MKKTRIALCLALFAVLGIARAENPVVQTHFAPDPAPWFIMALCICTPAMTFPATISTT